MLPWSSLIANLSGLVLIDPPYGILPNVSWDTKLSDDTWRTLFSKIEKLGGDIVPCLAIFSSWQMAKELPGKLLEGTLYAFIFLTFL